MLNKKNKTLIFLCAAIMVSSKSPEESKIEKKVIKVVSSDWCPFICVDEKGILREKTPGSSIEIIKEALNIAGYEMQYTTIPWSRAISGVRKGEYHGILGALRAETPDFIFPDEEAGVAQNCFFAREESQWKYTDIKSLENINLGIILDYSYDGGGIVDEYIARTQKENLKTVQSVATINGFTQNYKKILAKRIDAFVEEKQVTLYYMKNNKKEKDLKLAGCLGKQEFFLSLSPVLNESKDIKQAIDKGIKEMRKNGKLKEILSHYHLEDWR